MQDINTLQVRTSRNTDRAQVKAPAVCQESLHKHFISRQKIPNLSTLFGLFSLCLLWQSSYITPEEHFSVYKRAKPLNLMPHNLHWAISPKDNTSWCFASRQVRFPQLWIKNIKKPRWDDLDKPVKALQWKSWWASESSVILHHHVSAIVISSDY